MVGKTPDIGAALVQHALAGELAQRLLIVLRIHLIDVIRCQHGEHALLALDANGTRAVATDSLAAAVLA